MDSLYTAQAAIHAGLSQAARRGRNKLERDWNDFRAGELSGQGLIEYVLIIAVISLVIIFAGPAVAQAIRNQFAKIVSTLNKGTSTGF